MGIERTVKQTCRSCGYLHEGSPIELLEGAQCKSCKALLKAVLDPFAVDKAALDAILATIMVPVLVDVYWPGTQEARTSGTVLERVSRKLEGRGLIVKLDADEHREAAWDLGVTSTPTLLLFKKRALLHQWEGLADADLVEEWMRQAYRI